MKFVIANWKLNPPTLKEAKKIFQNQKKQIATLRFVNTIFAVPAPFIYPLAFSTRLKRVHFAAESVSAEKDGATVGEHSAEQVASVGATLALVGHSYNRDRGETDELIAQKVLRCIEAKVVPVVFVGEKERDPAGAYLRAIKKQIQTALSLIEKKHVKNIMIVYEPVWAIGAKEAMNPEQIQVMILFIYKIMVEIYGEKTANQVPILYGGSVNVKNASSFTEIAKLRGVVVGRASLEKSFADIVKAFNFKS